VLYETIYATHGGKDHTPDQVFVLSISAYAVTFDPGHVLYLKSNKKDKR
jgi:hypothetical protein